eukprot:g4000.t1
MLEEATIHEMTLTPLQRQRQGLGRVLLGAGKKTDHGNRSQAAGECAPGEGAPKKRRRQEAAAPVGAAAAAAGGGGGAELEAATGGRCSGWGGGGGRGGGEGQQQKACSIGESEGRRRGRELVWRRQQWLSQLFFGVA